MGHYVSLTFDAKLSPKGEEIVAAVLNVPESPNHVPFLYDRTEPQPDHTSVLVQPGATWCVNVSEKMSWKRAEHFLETVLPRLLREPCEVRVWDEDWDETQTRLVAPAEVP